MLQKIEDGRRRDQQKMRWLDGITNSMDMSKLRELVINRKVWPAEAHAVAKSRTRLSDLAELSLIPWQMDVKFSQNRFGEYCLSPIA